MHILIAPNAFKGSLSASEAAGAMAEGLRSFDKKLTYTLFPVADGGNDTMNLLTRELDGKQVEVNATNSLGENIRASYGWIEKEQKAIIGLSDVSGLHLIPNSKRNILHATTYGLGQVIKVALDRGAKELLIAVGGSATTDGGSGLLQALGMRYLDAAGNKITDLPYGLLYLETIDDRLLDSRLRHTKITVLSDVKNPLLGPKGAAVVFGPQKGAGQEEVTILENILQIWSQKIFQLTGADVSALPYSGAAGGTAAGLMGLTSAGTVSGISYFLDVLHFNDKLRNADFVFTGEGALDSQTLEGKGPLEVARRAKERNIPVIGFTGLMPDNIKPLIPHFTEIIGLSSPDENREKVMDQAGTRLKDVVEKWVYENNIN